jgi:uncharacterized protein (DUF433 family)
MATIEIYPHIIKEAGAPARLDRHPRNRVAMIAMEHLGRGLAPEEIVRHFRYLTLGEVHSAMAYYHDHRDEIDAEIQAELHCLEADPEANARSPIWLKLKAKGLL